MDIFNFIKRQLIDVIEWRDDSPDTLVYKFDDADCEIKNGAQLIVRDSQKAVFLHEGELGDVFGPGRYELTTQNIPILTSLKSWKYGFDSPFKCDVFFVSTRQFANQKWGTQNPIMMRDADFGMLRLRASPSGWATPPLSCGSSQAPAATTESPALWNICAARSYPG